MVEKLSVQIALEGAEEIERQFAGVSKAGQQCFADIQKAAANVGGFKNLDTGAIEASLKKFGITATAEIDKIKAALSSATKLEGRVLGIAELEQNFSKAGKAATAATAAFGLTRRELGALRTGLRQVDLGPIGNQLTAMGRIGSAFGPIGISIGAIGVAVAAATAATILFAQSITKVSAEAIKLGLSFQEFDAARKRLEGMGISADAISAGFAHVQQGIERLQLERVARDAATVRNGLDGSDAALKRLKQTALEFTAAGNAAAEALRQMDIKIPGLNEKDIKKFGLELTRLKTLVEQVTGQKVTIDADLNDPTQKLEVITELLRLLPHSAERTAAALQLLGPAIGTQVIQNLRLMEGSFTPIEANAIALTSAINQLQAAFARLGTVAFAPFITAEVKAVTAALQAIQNAIDNFSWGTFKNAADAAAKALQYFTVQGLAVLGLKFVWDLSGFDALISKLAQAAQSWLEYFGIASKAGGTPLPGGAPIGGPGGGIGSNAAGGLLGGRGTGTSDSNLAWVSRGEHIMPARAVSQPGVLAFLEALRRSGGNLSRVLDGMGRFALGGMVPRAIPAFAAGGLAGGMSNVTIQFPGLPAISGLRASSDVVDQLHKAAALAQVRSGGRKPSRYS